MRREPTHADSSGIRVLVVDDHQVVRDGLRALLSKESNIEVVGEAASLAEALQRVAFEHPDVAVLDVRLPDGSGIEACRQIRDRFPSVKVLMLTSFADIQALTAAVIAGAVGYVLKQARSDDLVDSIRRVSKGESLLDPDETEKLLSSWQEKPPDPLVARLSSQERAILNLIAAGLTNREIAGKMNLAEKTVKNYVSNLLTKMGMRRRTEAAAYKARLDVRKTQAYPPEISSDAD